MKTQGVLTTKCNLYTVFYTCSLSTTEWIPLGGSYHLTALLTSRDLTVPSVEVYIHTYGPYSIMQRVFDS